MTQRKIEFRGKRKDNKEWVYGNYVHNFRKGESHHIVDFDSNEWYEVFPESVGQFIGLKDNRDQKIFEKDCYRETIEYDGIEDDEFRYFICTYVKSQSAFCWVINVDYELGFHELDILPEDIENFSTICNEELHKIQIIGNICDKPKLLKI